MKSQIIELGEDLEICKGLLEKVTECKLHDLKEVFELLDDCLSGQEFLKRYVNTYIVETDTEELLLRIEKSLTETTMTVEKLVEYVLNCDTETQLAVTIDIHAKAGKDIYVPLPETSELIMYKLIDLDDYVNSLKYIYGEAEGGQK